MLQMMLDKCPFDCVLFLWPDRTAQLLFCEQSFAMTLLAPENKTSLYKSSNIVIRPYANFEIYAILQTTYTIAT